MLNLFVVCLSVAKGPFERRRKCLAGGLVIVTTALGAKALVPIPSLDQSAVHAEVFAREPPILMGNRLYFIEKPDDRVCFPRVILGSPLLKRGRAHDIGLGP